MLLLLAIVLNFLVIVLPLRLNLLFNNFLLFLKACELIFLLSPQLVSLLHVILLLFVAIVSCLEIVGIFNFLCYFINFL